MNLAHHPQSKILIIDDQHANLMLMEDILSQVGYNQLRFVDDSRLATKVFDEFAPDLVILDLMMPNVDGFQIMDELLPRVTYQSFLPILVLTADSNPNTRRKALAAGARDFLTKPIDAIETVLRVNNLLELRHLHSKLERRVKEQTRQVYEQARVIDHAREAIIGCDQQEQIITWNQGAESVFGVTRPNVLGKALQEIFPFGESPEWQFARTKFSEQGSWHGEIRLNHGNAQETILDCRWTKWDTGENGERKSLLLFSDVTEQRRVEVQYLRAQRMESIGLLAGGIAHDLNNVLAPVMMGIDLLLQTPQDPENVELLNTMLSSVNRGAELIRQILLFARGEVGKREPVNLRSLLMNFTNMLKRTFPKSITVHSEIAESLYPVTVDSTQIYQVLTNLCVNARDAMPNGGRLTIRAMNQTHDTPPAGLKTTNTVCISVADTGTGIPKEIINKIFDPFFTTKDVGKGTGLGLSTVQGIITNHEGVLNLESECGLGTVFSIELPSSVTESHAEQQLCKPQIPHGNGEHVLFVDDEPSLREMANTALTKAGYHVTLATNGQEALQMFQHNQNMIDLILTDMRMPVLDGANMIHQIRRTNDHIKIALFSGTDHFADSSTIIPSANLFIPKPYSIEILLQSVRTLLETKQPT